MSRLFYIVLVDDVPMAVTEMWNRAKMMRDEMETSSRVATIIPVHELDYYGFYDGEDFMDEEPTNKDIDE